LLRDGRSSKAVLCGRPNGSVPLPLDRGEEQRTCTNIVAAIATGCKSSGSTQ